ncbi:MAG: hypothetical protein Q9202_007502 [Teloschistes flavicans]
MTLAADASLYAPDYSNKPFLIIESAYSQTDEDVRGKFKQWSRGSDYLGIICILKSYTDKSSQVRVLATIARTAKIMSPTTENPEAFKRIGKVIVDKAEIYPARATESFDICLEDIFQQDPHLEDFSHQARKQPVNIPLKDFWEHGKYAAVAIRQSANKVPYQLDPNQIIESDTSSSGSSFHSESDEDDKSRDGDYKGSG